MSDSIPSPDVPTLFAISEREASIRTEAHPNDTDNIAYLLGLLDAARFAAAVMDEAARVLREEVERLQDQLTLEKNRADFCRDTIGALERGFRPEVELLNLEKQRLQDELAVAKNPKPWKCQKCGGMSWQSIKTGRLYGKECLDCRIADFGVMVEPTGSTPPPDVSRSTPTRREQDAFIEAQMEAVSKFELAQAPCETGGWFYGDPPTPEQIHAANRRWASRAYREDAKDEDGDIIHQCGGCRFFAATGMDYGICWNEKSPLDGCISFEHGGCKEHSAFMEDGIP